MKISMSRKAGSVRLRRSGKKLLYIVPVIMLLAAGCNASQQASTITPPPQNTNPGPSPTPTQTPDETANWRVYSNARYGYTIKYPQSWYIDMPYSEKDFNFIDSGVWEKYYAGGDTFWGNYPSISSYDLGNVPKDAQTFCHLLIYKDKDINDYLKRMKPSNSQFLTVLAYELTNLGENDKLLYESINSKDHPVGIFKTLTRYVQKDSNLYTIGCSIKDDSDRQMYNKVLSTFKFTK